VTEPKILTEPPKGKIKQLLDDVMWLHDKAVTRILNTENEGVHLRSGEATKLITELRLPTRTRAFDVYVEKRVPYRFVVNAVSQEEALRIAQELHGLPETAVQISYQDGSPHRYGSPTPQRP